MRPEVIGVLLVVAILFIRNSWSTSNVWFMLVFEDYTLWVLGIILSFCSVVGCWWWKADVVLVDPLKLRVGDHSFKMVPNANPQLRLNYKMQVMCSTCKWRARLYLHIRSHRGQTLPSGYCFCEVITNSEQLKDHSMMSRLVDVWQLNTPQVFQQLPELPHQPSLLDIRIPKQDNVYRRPESYRKYVRRTKLRKCGTRFLSIRCQDMRSQDGDIPRTLQDIVLQFETSSGLVHYDKHAGMPGRTKIQDTLERWLNTW